MPSHPYLRAYMAGLVVPSVAVCLVALAVAAFFGSVSPQIERAMIFPMAINPAAWGVWNMLHVWLRNRQQRIPIQWHGAILALLLVLAGTALARFLEISFVTVKGAALVTLPTVAAYYFIWKYVVRFLNELLDVTQASHSNRRLS